MEEKAKLQVDWSGLFYALVFILLLVIFYFVKDIVLLFIASLIIASAVGNWAFWLNRRFKFLPYSLAVVFIYVVVSAAFITLLYSLLPVILAQVANLPVIINKITTGKITFDSPFLKTLQQVSAPLLGQMQNYVGNVGTFITNTFGGFISAVVVVVISFYLSFEERGVEKLLKVVSPEKYQDIILRIWGTSQKKFSEWSFAQIILMIILGLTVYVAMLVLGVPYASLLGVIAGVLEIVPYLGPILTGVLAVLLAISKSTSLATWAVIVFVVIDQIEKHVLVPVLMHRHVQIHPVLVILAILVGGTLGGFLGVLVSVPITSVIIQLIQDFGRPKPEEIVPASNSNS